MESKKSHIGGKALAGICVVALAFFAIGTYFVPDEHFVASSSDVSSGHNKQVICFQLQSNGGEEICIDLENTATTAGKDHIARCMAGIYTGDNCNATNISLSTDAGAPAAGDETCPNKAASDGFNSTNGTAAMAASGNWTSGSVKWTASGSVADIQRLCLESYNGTLLGSTQFTAFSVISGDNVTGQAWYAIS